MFLFNFFGVSAPDLNFWKCPETHYTHSGGATAYGLEVTLLDSQTLNPISRLVYTGMLFYCRKARPGTYCECNRHDVCVLLTGLLSPGLSVPLQVPAGSGSATHAAFNDYGSTTPMNSMTSHYWPRI